MLAQQLQTTISGTVRRHESMARHTTWRVGGPAELFVVPASINELQTVLQALEAAGCRWLVCGYGSNVLVRDGGIDGAVIHTGQLRRFEIHADGRIVADAGVPLMLLVRRAVAAGLAGIESMAGIPATIGGAVAMNAGAHGQAIGDVVSRVTTCRAQGCREWPASACEFGYHRCRLPEEGLVAAVELQLHPGERRALAARMHEVLVKRRAAHAVGGPNAGSVFRNPPQQPAGRLIDMAGLRGRRRGGARVAEKHANFIVNDGSATAADIEALMQEVVVAVEAHSSIRLVPEVRIWGRSLQVGEA